MLGRGKQKKRCQQGEGSYMLQYRGHRTELTMLFHYFVKNGIRRKKSRDDERGGWRKSSCEQIKGRCRKIGGHLKGNKNSEKNHRRPSRKSIKGQHQETALKGKHQGTIPMDNTDGQHHGISSRMRIKGQHHESELKGNFKGQHQGTTLKYEM